MEADLEKLQANLGGVADMKRQPDAVFVIDMKKEQLAVRETQRLGVPVIGLVDTNADPDEANFVIPGNDDAIRSCNLVTRVIADGIAAGTTKVTPGELVAEAVRPAEEAGEAGRRARARAGREAERAGRSSPRSSRVSAVPLRRASRCTDRMTTTIGASLVKELRDLTGAGMMDCKRALEETGGDLESARVLLRERGMASAGKRAGRTTTEGLVRFILDGSTGSIAGIGCETEPVSKNEEFLAFAEAVLRAIHAKGPEAVESFEQERAELIAKLGENIVVVGAERFDAPDGNVVAGYSTRRRTRSASSSSSTAARAGSRQLHDAHLLRRARMDDT